MAFALWRKRIRCTNCGYEGKASVQGTGCGWWLALLTVFIVAFLFWPLFIVAVLMFLWLVFKPANQICPKCKFPNPVPM